MARSSKKKKAALARPPFHRGILGFLAIVIPAGAFAGGWLVWRDRHRPVAALSLPYREPGWLPAAKSDRWKCIVIHHSASDVGGAARYDRAHRDRGWDGLGYHFVIGNGSDTADGKVEIGFRWPGQIQGAHCKTPDHFYNDHGIGICLVGNFDDHPPTRLQMQTLARLVRFLCAEFNIPKSNILTHGGVTGKTDCPGKQFDLDQLKRLLR